MVAPPTSNGSVKFMRTFLDKLWASTFLPIVRLINVIFFIFNLLFYIVWVLRLIFRKNTFYLDFFLIKKQKNDETKNILFDNQTFFTS